MNIGEKIRRIRSFRGMTQKELGIALGLKGDPQTRIAQYETGYRVPKRDLILRMAEVLDVCVYALDSENEGSSTVMIEMLFWADVESSSILTLATAKRNDKKYNSVMGYEIEYTDNDDWMPREPTMLWFNHVIVNDALREWAIRQQELRDKIITRDEYFEWKLQWPYSCDDCGRVEPVKKWRGTTGRLWRNSDSMR